MGPKLQAFSWLKGLIYLFYRTWHIFHNRYNLSTFLGLAVCMGVSQSAFPSNFKLDFHVTTRKQIKLVSEAREAFDLLEKPYQT